MENILTDELKEIIISEKYDLELISFEFDIPIEQLIEYKNKLSKRNNNETMNETEIDQDVSNDKINELFESLNQCQKERDIERIRKSITKLIKKIKTMKLSIEQCEFILNEIGNDFASMQVKKSIELKYLDAIDQKVKEINDANKLKEIRRKLTPEVCKRNLIITDGLKIKIDMKLNKINSRNATEQLYENISPDILSIALDLARGVTKSEKAIELINNETQKRMQNSPKTVFQLNEKQQRKQVIMQIKGCLRRSANEFPIDNPNATIEQLQTLGDINQIDAIGIVIQNMIKRSKFEDARKLCDEYCTTKDRENPMYPHISSIRNMIKSAENKQKDSSELIK